MHIRERFFYALSTARGTVIEYDLAPYRKVVEEIRAVDLSRMSDAALRRTAHAIRDRVRAGAHPDGELVTVYALAAEASLRLLGLRPFDEQLIAGIAMSKGKLAQMQTGEGKTLAAVFPACLAGLAGAGVHVLTANDYLAARDARWMGPVYEAMGLSVSAIGERTDAPGGGQRTRPT